MHEAINERLRRDNLEEHGKLLRKVAHLYLPPDADQILRRGDKTHMKSPTCVRVHGPHAFTASKDGGLVKWEFATGAKVLKKLGLRRKGAKVTEKGHASCINAIAVSSDGKYLATGDDDKLIHIWNPDTFEHIHTFKGHRDCISGLAFRKRTHTLYSCSLDRAVKIWSLDEMAYVETL